MPKTRTSSALDLPEVFVSDKTMTSQVYRELQLGKLRKLASKLYTRNLTDSPEVIVKRHVWELVAQYFPNALIADRTALEYMPSNDGAIFIISEKKRSVQLPGIHIKPRRGVAALDSDRPFISGLFLSSQARAYLENMRSSRVRGKTVRRTLTRKEIEGKLDSILRSSDEKALLSLRDEARALAPTLSLQREAKRLDQIIGTLLGTKNLSMVSQSGKMRKIGKPYDPERVALFQKLFEALASSPPVFRIASKSTQSAMINLAFFEAYFSNFIEGTEFAVDEAEDIIFHGNIPITRPEDAHDIIGTFKIVSDLTEMQKTPKSFDDFLLSLKSRHATIMSFRKEKRPGEFKIEPNKAGSTLCVAPELVIGTLHRGFEFYQALEFAFDKAIFMMFLVSEVHPFADGNGRVARIMMNAEFVAKNEQRIIIPTVYRNNYLQALKALSLNQVMEPLVRMLDFAQKYTHAIDWQELARARYLLEQTHAFIDPLSQDVRLVMP